MLPVGDVALLGGEGDAYLGDGTPVEGVLIGVALAVDLVEGSLHRIIVFQFYDVDALGHEQRQV